MKMTVPYKYKLEYYPSNRHRKVREAMLQGKTQIEIREINEEEMSLAANYYKREWRSDNFINKPLYFFENRLYGESKKIIKIFQERAQIAEWGTERHNQDEYNKFVEKFGAVETFANHADEAIAKLREYTNKIIYAGEKFYYPIETEPVFRYSHNNKKVVFREHGAGFDTVKHNAADIDWSKTDKEESRVWMEIIIPEAFKFGRDMEKVDKEIQRLAQDIWSRLFIGVTTGFYPEKALCGILPAVIERVKHIKEQPYMFDEYTVKDAIAIVLDEKLGK